jgi:molybdate transport system substrate-binding protein
MRRAAIVLVVLVAGCGGEAAGDDRPQLVVSAAASLTDALTECSKRFEGADVRLSFAGSDELAAQIRQGVKPDVYAAANTSLPQELADEGLLGRPVEFVTNELVIAVPAEGGKVSSIDDLAQPGTKLVIGAESVPVGAYTREVLAQLPPGQEQAILDNVRSEEPDVKGVVGKVAQSAADAGFVYNTDVTAAGDDLEAVTLPENLQPTVTYGAGVVEGAEQPELAQLGHDLTVEALMAVGLEYARHQLLLRVLAGGVADQAFVLGELVVEEERVVPLEFGAARLGVGGLGGGFGRGAGGWRHRGLLRR